MQLKVNEIFKSIMGEVSYFPQGKASVFVRLQQCNLSCPYCDTPKAQDSSGGRMQSVDGVLEKVLSYWTESVVITGGEPLLQEEPLSELCKMLYEQGKMVTLETNGSFPVPFYVQCIVMDYKLNNSGSSHLMKFKHFENLKPSDFVKFVISDKADFVQALHIKWVLQEEYGCRAQFAFSADSSKLLCPYTLFQWMDAEASLHDSILNIQIHKIINLP